MVNHERKAKMLRIRRILRKKEKSPDELSVVLRYFVNLLHGSSQGSEEFDLFNMVFIDIWCQWVMDKINK